MVIRTVIRRKRRGTVSSQTQTRTTAESCGGSGYERQTTKEQANQQDIIDSDRATDIGRVGKGEALSEKLTMKIKEIRTQWMSTDAKKMHAKEEQEWMAEEPPRIINTETQSSMVSCGGAWTDPFPTLCACERIDEWTRRTDEDTMTRTNNNKKAVEGPSEASAKGERTRTITKWYLYGA